MKPFVPLSTCDQLVEHLEKEIISGRLTGAMPGVSQLVKTLGINSETTAKALRQLESRGLIISQGGRRRRLIVENSKSVINKSIRLGVLYYDSQNEYRHYALLLKQELIDAGHTPVTLGKTMKDFGMNIERIKKYASSFDVDAWIIYSGSFDILKWFSSCEKPAFAIFGRLLKLPISGVSIRRAAVIEQVVKHLVELGHRRIVYLVREDRRAPNIGAAERYFIEQLEKLGVTTGPYNIPDWEDTQEGLDSCIDKLVEHTPPTAVCVGDSTLLHAVQVHFANRGFIVPRDLSLFCNDYTESFDWTKPCIAHIKWDYRPAIRRVMNWVKGISEGKNDQKVSFIDAEFIRGGTIGPAAKF